MAAIGKETCSRKAGIPRLLGLVPKQTSTGDRTILGSYQGLVKLRATSVGEAVLLTWWHFWLSYQQAFWGRALGDAGTAKSLVTGNRLSGCRVTPAIPPCAGPQ